MCPPPCPIVETTTPPTVGTPPPETCINGAPDEFYPDCCFNGGHGPFCCRNGAENRYCCVNGEDNPWCGPVGKFLFDFDTDLILMKKISFISDGRTSLRNITTDRRVNIIFKLFTINISYWNFHEFSYLIFHTEHQHHHRHQTIVLDACVSLAFHGKYSYILSWNLIN